MEILKFGAKWCATCKTLDKKMESWDQGITSKVTKVDIDANITMAQKYGVRGLPTVVVIADGVELARLSGGAITEEALKQYA